MFNRILIAFDAGESARQAIETGIHLAAEHRAALALVHVLSPPIEALSEAASRMQELFENEQQRAAELMREIRRRVPPEIEVTEYIATGNAPEQIVATAERWGADLIVVGTHGAGRLGSFLLGSTAQAVIRKAPCPVLVVRQKLVPQT